MWNDDHEGLLCINMDVKSVDRNERRAVDVEVQKAIVVVTRLTKVKIFTLLNSSMTHAVFLE